MRRTILAAAALALLVATSSGVAAAQVTVKVGDLGIISDASLYIAVARGHFKERGIEVQFERFASAAPAIAHLSTGEIQVVGGGISPALYNALARGLPIKIVAARTREMPGRTINALVSAVRNEARKEQEAELKASGRSSRTAPTRWRS